MALREVQILKALSKMEGSRYIARLLDFLWLKEEHTIFLVMEYKEGVTLEEFIKRASIK